MEKTMDNTMEAEFSTEGLTRIVLLLVAAEPDIMLLPNPFFGAIFSPYGIHT